MRLYAISLCLILRKVTHTYVPRVSWNAKTYWKNARVVFRMAERNLPPTAPHVLSDNGELRKRLTNYRSLRGASGAFLVASVARLHGGSWIKEKFQPRTVERRGLGLSRREYAISWSRRRAPASKMTLRKFSGETVTRRNFFSVCGKFFALRNSCGCGI